MQRNKRCLERCRILNCKFSSPRLHPDPMSGAKMGLPGDNDQFNGNMPSGHKPQKATLSGLTAFIGVVALIADIISVAVPHWGKYSPYGDTYFKIGEILRV